MERSVRVSRPQLVCVLADNSGSMRGAQAEAATRGIQEMLMQCQMKGPSGRHRSYFRFVLIRFGSHAKVDKGCYMKPVREIDPDTISIRGDGGGTNITEALEQVYSGLKRYITEIENAHPESDQHPLPVVLLFSDGHNGGSCPLGVADRIKSLNLNGDCVTIAAASVWVEGSMPPDGNLLREIASPGCYVNVDRPELLTEFLSQVGSSAAMSSTEVARITAPLDRPVHNERPAISYSQASPAPQSASPSSERARKHRSRKRSGRNRNGKNPSSHAVTVHRSAPPANSFHGLGD